MALSMFPVSTPGTNLGPPAPDYYKRAVYHPPPRHFTVHMLEPAKIGGAYSYGIRISAIINERASTITNPRSEYVIWRRWDDCLYFQELLEVEYEILSREKRARLQAGKGVKKNGIYIHDQAASFESLPNGPDPKSVAKDIHQYLPKLPRKGTLFRPSQATIAQRFRDFSAFINTLMGDDVPALIAELREERVIRDFFGIWRRDHDILQKRKGDTSSVGSLPFSLSSSNISLSFSTSNFTSSTNTPFSPVSPLSKSMARGFSARRFTSSSASSFSLSDTDSSGHSAIPPSSAPAHLSTTKPAGSLKDKGKEKMTVPPIITNDRSPSSPKSPRRSSSKGPHTSPRDNSFSVEELPLFISSSSKELLFSPRTAQSSARSGPPVGGLESLPEDQELGSPEMRRLSHGCSTPLPVPRGRSLPVVNKSNRNCVLFMESTDADDISSSEGDILDPELQIPPVIASDKPVDKPLLAPASISSRPSSVALSSLSFQSRRSSWRTSGSGNGFCSRPSSACSTGSIFELDLPFLETMSISGADRFSGSPSGRNRLSMDSVLTENSADAVVYRGSLSGPPLNLSTGQSMWHSFSGKQTRSYSQPSPLPECVTPDSDVDPLDWFSLPNEDNSADRLSLSDQQPPLPRLYHSRSANFTQVSLPRSPPPTCPLPDPPESPMSIASDSDTLVVKAVLDDAIVVFRVSRSATLAEVRGRVFDKFARQEGLSLSNMFSLACAPPTPYARPRANSNPTDSACIWPITSQDDWEHLIAGCGPHSKLVMRISP